MSSVLKNGAVYCLCALLGAGATYVGMHKRYEPTWNTKTITGALAENGSIVTPYPASYRWPILTVGLGFEVDITNHSDRDITIPVASLVYAKIGWRHHPQVVAEAFWSDIRSSKTRG